MDDTRTDQDLGPDDDCPDCGAEDGANDLTPAIHQRGCSYPREAYEDRRADLLHEDRYAV